MTNLFFSSYDQHLQWTMALGLSLLLQTGLVIGFGLLAARILRHQGAALQSAILRTTLLATLFCPIASWFLASAGISGFRIDLASHNQNTNPRPVVAPTSPEDATIVQQAGPTTINEAPPFPDTTTVQFPTPVIPMLGQDSPVEPTTSPPTDPPFGAIETRAWQPGVDSPDHRSRWRTSYRIVIVIWSLMSSLLLARLVIANLVMWRLRSESGPAPAEILRECQSIAIQMGITAPPVLINASLSSPCLTGLWRPTIMLPAELQPLGLHVLAHELAHLKRGDCGWSLIGHLLTALVPWQPLAWWLARRLEQIADEVCDDYVVAHNFDRVSYARELLAIAERFPASWSTTTTAVGIADYKSCLGRRVQRILDGARNVSFQTKRTPLVFVIVAAACATMLASLLGASANEKPSRDDASNEHAAAAPKANDAAETVMVTGTVLTPDGTPAVGATVRALHRVSPELRPLLPADFVPTLYETQTNTEGQFSISVSRDAVTDHRIPLNQRSQSGNSIQFAAALRGFGVAWKELSDLEANQDVTLNLVDNSPLRGQILDPAGRPLKGVQLSLNEVYDIPADTSLVTWWATAEYYELPFVKIHPRRPRSAPARLLGMQAPVTSDANGCIELHGLGANRGVVLTLRGENIAIHNFVALSRDLKQEEQTNLSSRMHIPTYGQDFTLTTAPSRSIDGVIVDSRTGEPLSGVQVDYHIPGNPIANRARLAPTVTSDRMGHFRLTGIPRLPEALLCLRPNHERPYLPRRIPVTDFDERKSTAMSIELHQGIWISGRVVDKVTREPVSGVSMHYLPYEDNTFAIPLPEFAGDDPPDLILEQYLTDFDGRYRLVGLPGPAVIGANKDRANYIPGTGFQALRQEERHLQHLLKTWPNPKRPSRDWPLSLHEINPTLAQPNVEANLELDPGLHLTLRIVDEAGSLVEGATFFGLDKTLTIKGNAVRTIEHMPRGTILDLLVQHHERSIGATIQIEPRETLNEATIRLLPLATVTGRLLHADRPMPDLTIRVFRKSKDLNERWLPTTFITDRDGRFRCELVPGGNYHLVAEGPGIIGNFARITKDVVTADEPLDLGDLKLGLYGTFESVASATIEGDAPQPAIPTYDFEGQVIGPYGHPVHHARIFIGSTRLFSRDTDQLDLHAITDKDGCFQFSLPASDNGRSYETAELIAAAKEFGFVTVPAIACETTGKLREKLPETARATLEKRFPKTPRVLYLRANERPLNRSFMKKEQFDLEP
ncbi:M56 family metallopeptidase [Schlesneria paludicola]|uniref:M56 family metallopeptidase n=1 Tax=Schlesneria paludicola TaxID=360056 RepID=UPI00029AA8AC|nr:M56 family metallopeptidase [Schlesneria paludicola]